MCGVKVCGAKNIQQISDCVAWDKQKWSWNRQQRSSGFKAYTKLKNNFVTFLFTTEQRDLSGMWIMIRDVSWLLQFVWTSSVYISYRITAMISGQTFRYCLGIFRMTPTMLRHEPTGCFGFIEKSISDEIRKLRPERNWQRKWTDCILYQDCGMGNAQNRRIFSLFAKATEK